MVGRPEKLDALINGSVHSSQMHTNVHILTLAFLMGIVQLLSEKLFLEHRDLALSPGVRICEN